MESKKAVGRIVGVLMLLQMCIAAMVNFALLGPVFGAPGFLVNGAGHPTMFALSALLGIASGLLTLGIAIAAYPIFRQCSHAMALWFVALAVVGLSTIVVENINLMSMLSLSESFAKANSVDRDILSLVRVIVASARNWAHFIGLMVAGATLWVFYSVLYRFALIPRVLSAFGLLAVLSQITAVAMPLFGNDVVFLMLAPLGFCQLAVAIWLIVKGLRVTADP
jgi:Domain of unknown function (DUF4386)